MNLEEKILKAVDGKKLSMVELAQEIGETQIIVNSRARLAVWNLIGQHKLKIDRDFKIEKDGN